MLGLFRGFLNTWAARAFFLLLVGAFVLWGVGDVLRNSGGPGNDAAAVGGERITVQQLDDAYRNQLAQIAQMTNNRALSPAERTQVAQLTLEQLIQNALVQSQARAMGLAAPDAAVRDAVYAIPAFQRPSGGPNAQFDRNALNAWLQGNGMTEARMLDIVRAGLLRDQLLNPLRAGVAAPDALLRPVFAFQNQTRVAATVAFPFDAVPDPAAPTEADLHELYDDNPGAYSAPAYRRVRMVILSADTVAKGIEVSDADIAAAYDGNKSRYVQPEKRAAEVVLAPDEAVAGKIASDWKDGADWDAVGKAAAAAGATSISVPDSLPDEYPSAELSKAVFAAAPDSVTGPLPAPGGGVMVVRVTNVVAPKNETLEQAHDAIRDGIAHERAAAQLADAKDRLETELSSVAKLEDLPAGLGVAAAVGTMDAQGNTPEGEPAPVPASPAVKQAIVSAAFSAEKDALPVLQDAPDGTSFALQVEDTSPPKLRPFEDVKDKLTDDYEMQARRRVQDEAATKLLVAARKSNLEDAAAVAGLRVSRSEAMRRDGAPPEGVPAQAIAPLFALKKGEVTVVETPEGFTVLTPAEVTDPEPGSDPAAAAQLRTALNKQLADDVEITYVNVLRGRARPVVNPQVLSGMAQ